VWSDIVEMFKGLWPTWRLTDQQAASFKRHLTRYPLDTVARAIDEHYTRESKSPPALSDLLDIVRGLQRQESEVTDRRTFNEEQQRIAEQDRLVGEYLDRIDATRRDALLTKWRSELPRVMGAWYAEFIIKNPASLNCHNRFFRLWVWSEYEAEVIA